MDVSTITNSLSNRELALLLWIGILILLLFLIRSTRQDLVGIAKTFFSLNIISVLVGLILYISAFTFLLYKVDLWHLYLLKDTALWFFSVALVLFFNINKSDNSSYFLKIIKESCKWTITLEFIMNFYTFGLLTEIILVPMMAFIVVIRTYSGLQLKQESKYALTNQVFSRIFAYTGWLFGSFILYKTISQYKQLLSIANLEALLLPIVYTLITLPFMYFLALYIHYETLFVRICFMTNDIGLQSRLKKQIITSASLNLNKLVAISKDLKKGDVYRNNNLSDYFQRLST